MISLQPSPAPFAFTVTPPAGQPITLCSESRSVELGLELLIDAQRCCGACARLIPERWLRRITDHLIYAPS